MTVAGDNQSPAASQRRIEVAAGANDFDPTNPVNILYTEQTDAWSWNGGTHTLSLNGFNWTTPAPIALVITDSNNPISSGNLSNLSATINLTGNNTFQSGGDAAGMSVGILSLISNVTLQGSGVLNAISGNASPVVNSFGITAGMDGTAIGAVTVNGGTLNASSGEATISCALSSDLTVNGGAVNAAAGQVQGAGMRSGSYGNAIYLLDKQRRYERPRRQRNNRSVRHSLQLQHRG